MKKERFQENIYMKLIGKCYYILALNLLLALLLLPLILAINLLAFDWRNLFWFMLTALPFGGGLLASFGTVSLFLQEDSSTPVKDFGKMLRRFFKPSFKYWLPVLLVVSIVTVDLIALAKHPDYFWISGILILLVVLTIGLFLNCCYFQVRNPMHNGKDVLRISFYYTFRKWYVSVINVLLFSLLVTAAIIKSSVGLLVLPYLFIILIYLNCGKLHTNQVKQKREEETHANNGNTLYP